MLSILSPTSGKSFIEPGAQRVGTGTALALAMTVTAIGAAKVDMSSTQVLDIFESFLAITAQYASADVTASVLRHPTPGVHLDWEWHGRGGHVIGVALGLGASFAVGSAVFGAIDSFPEVLAPFRGVLEQFAKLFIGIEPWVVYDAIKNPAHEGNRVNVLVEQTLRNALGSAAAAALEPVVGAVLTSTMGSSGGFWKAVSDQLTTIFGYTTVLMAGWGDWGMDGLSDAELRKMDV